MKPVLLHPGATILWFISAFVTLSPLASEPTSTWFQMAPFPAPKDTLPSLSTLDFPLTPAGAPVPDPSNRSSLILQGTSVAWSALDGQPDPFWELPSQPASTDRLFGYAYARILSPENRIWKVGLGSDDGIALWFNGQKIFENPSAKAHRLDQDLLSLPLIQGTNHLVLKIRNEGGPWGFSLRPLTPARLDKLVLEAVQEQNLDRLQKVHSLGGSLSQTNAIGLTPWHLAKVMHATSITAWMETQPLAISRELPEPASWMDHFLTELTDPLHPGFSVLVAQKGRVLLEKGYGLANLNYDLPNTPNTLFRIGSITKTFTSAAILQLAGEGKLTLNTPISTYFPDYPRGDEIHLRHLLSHTSGIKNFTSKPEFVRLATQSTSQEELIESFKNDPLDFNPGERWSYSNSGYILLGAVIEKVSGLDLSTYFQQKFFTPFQMEHTGIHNPTLILKNEATGYSWNNSTSESSNSLPSLPFQQANNWDLSWAGAAGALYSTSRDLYKWTDAFFKHPFLSPGIFQEALTPVHSTTEQALSTETKSPQEGYGLGWTIQQDKGLLVYEHSGGLLGFTSHLSYYPESDTCICVLANSFPTPPGRAPTQTVRALANILLWKSMRPLAPIESDHSLSDSLAHQLMGRYNFQGLVMEITGGSKQLFAQITGQPRLPIFAESEKKFFWKAVPAYFLLVHDENQQIKELILHQNGLSFHLPRLPDLPPSTLKAEQLEAYLGTYLYPGGQRLNVSQEDHRLFAQMTGQPRFELFHVKDHTFRWKFLVAEIQFVPDPATGQIHQAIHRQNGSEFSVSRQLP